MGQTVGLTSALAKELLQTAGGPNSCVRDTNRWLSSVSKSNPSVSLSTSPIDSEYSLSSASSMLSSSPSSVSSLSIGSSASSEASLSEFSGSFGSRHPPSPPISTLSAANLKFSGLVLSPASVDTADYFSAAPLSFMSKIFPNDKSANFITVADSTNTWSLALCADVAADKRTLYAKGDVYQAMNMRENLVDLLDRADIELDCDNLVVVLKKNDKSFADMLHSLLYVGGVVIPRTAESSHGKISPAYVLVGIDL